MRQNKFFRSLFYRPKHDRPEQSGLFRMLLPSVLSIAMCMMCMSGLAWAWYSTDIEADGQTITAATYDVTVSVVKVDRGATGGVAGGTGFAAPVLPGILNKITNAAGVTPDADGTYHLDADSEYVVTLTADSSVEGYCVISDGAAYYRAVPTADGFSFTIKTGAADLAWTFEAKWGAPDANDASMAEITSESNQVIGAGAAADAQPQTPEDTQPQTPEDTQPQAPEDTQPQAPEGTQPQAPEDTQPQTPEDTQPQAPEDTQPQTPEDTQPQTPENLGASGESTESKDG